MGKNFWQAFQNLNLVIQGNILRKNGFSTTKISIVLLLWAKTSGKFGGKIWTPVLKTAFYVYRGTFRWALLEKQFHFIILGFYLRKNIQHLINKNVAFVLKMQSSCPGNNLRENKIWKEQNFSSISYFGRENFELSANKIRQGFQDCIIRVQVNVSRNFFPKEKHNFFIASRLWANNHGTFWGKKSAWSSKLHFKSAARRLEVLFGKSSFLFITFGLYPQKNIELLAVQLEHARWNAVCVTRGTFGKKTDFFEIYFYRIICPSRTFSDFQPIFFRT